MNTNLGRTSGEIVAYRVDGALAIYDYTNEDEFDIGHVVMSDGRKARQVPLLSILAHGYWSDDLSAVMNPFTLRKHQANRHDQKTHGRWAGQMELEGLESAATGEFGVWGDRAAELEAAQSIGPDEEYLRDAVFKIDPDSVSDMEVRQRVRTSAILLRDSDSMNEVFNVTNKGFNFDGAPVNLSSNVTSIQTSNGKVSVRGEIKEGDFGITVGEFHRIFSSDSNGDVIVTHELLQIFEKEYQGTGFSKVFNRQAENYYITHGIDTIFVHAGLDGGGYTWASSGFDWDYGQHSNSVDNVSGKIDDYLYGNKNISADLFADLESLKTRLESSPVSNKDYPTPKEIADLGRISTVDTWPGKEIMTGSNWYGKKTLRPDGSRVSTTQAKRVAESAAESVRREERARVAADLAPGTGQLTMDGALFYESSD